MVLRLLVPFFMFMTPDGSKLLSDDDAGVIYPISYGK